MSLYGISRLLGNRELGPAQLLPTLQAFSSHAGNNGELLRAMFAELREAAPPSLVEPIGQLEAASVQVAEDIVEMFARMLSEMACKLPSEQSSAAASV